MQVYFERKRQNMYVYKHWRIIDGEVISGYKDRRIVESMQRLLMGQQLSSGRVMMRKAVETYQ